MLRWVARRLRTTPVVIALSLARMSEALGHSLLIVMLPLYVAARPSTLIDLPREMLIGVMVSAFGFVLAGSMRVAGRLSDRWGHRKWLILTGLLLMALATAGFPLADGFVTILALRSLQGIAVALVTVPALSLISSTTAHDNRGNSLGLYGSFRMLGFTAGPLVGGLLHHHFGFAAAFLTGSAFILLALVLVHFTVPDDGPARPRSPMVAVDDGQEVAGWSGRSRVTLLVLTFGQLVLAASLSLLGTLENLFNERLGQSALAFGVAFSALTATQIVSQVLVGRLSDRLGRKRLVAIGFALLGPILLTMASVQTSLQLVLLMMLFGATTACTIAPSLALAGDLAEADNVGRDMSAITMGFALGLAVGPLLGGMLASASGLGLPFKVFGGVALLAAVLMGLFATDRYGKSVVGKRADRPK